MGEFEKAFARLNKKQLQAVTNIDGPVLVIAGPGTGKTQLLALRVANIIRRTDTAPGNILCLTFTDNAARNMRERLMSIIGQPAYHVAVHTFHSFGGEVINQFPDYFTKRNLLQQVDELGHYELLKNIFEDLPHSNPLSTKVGDDFIHLRNTQSVVGWLKQNGLTPRELQQIINANKKFIEMTADKLTKTFISTPSSKQLNIYGELLATVQAHQSNQRMFGFADYGSECAKQLEQAIAATDSSKRYAPAITAWRNRWCQKNANGEHVFKDGGTNLRKMYAVANIYQQLEDDMAAQGLYDFDDMIMEVVHTLESDDELRLNLQERYQYILVDEFQDTNKAQLRMLNALGDNPVNEGRPNIMAVGDDDQAIYAFQGAEVSNMVAFAKQYRQPTLISLQDNYRSTANILDVSFAVATQISDRLETVLPDTHKELTVQAKHESDILQHCVFSSELAQYDFIAEQISDYVKAGMAPEEIAVIAPRHKYLERLVPYLINKQIPVAYERRENILDAPIINQLLTMARLVVAIEENRQDDVDTLVSQVLGYDFWKVPVQTLLDISMLCYKERSHWLTVLAGYQEQDVQEICSWFMKLAKNSTLEPMEYVLDQLTGSTQDGIDSEYDNLVLPQKTKSNFISPLRAYYFKPERYEHATDNYLSLLGQLSTLRHRLRQWKPNQELYIKDLVRFADLHQAAKLKIVDTNPHTQTTNAVQVMTAYKAKGLEFDAVFIINAQDEVWGPTAKRHYSTISLPMNLPIAPTGDHNNDKLRLLFVALTRARKILQITSYTHSLDNKLSPQLGFLISQESKDIKPIHPKLKAIHIDKPPTVRATEILTTDWAYRFRKIIANKTTLLEPFLADYKLSVTHLNNFIDVKDGGPQYFFMHNLLRFPESITPSAAYGDAIHKTLQWIQTSLHEDGQLPPLSKLQNFFSDLLDRKHLRKSDYVRLDGRGREALELYISHRGKDLEARDMIERGFNNEGVIISGANLSGKIDKLHFGKKGEIQVIDFKTGKPAKSWRGRDEYEKIKLHKYRQQLLFYKLLVENSASYTNKLTVTSGALEFIEPDENGKLVTNLELEFEAEELQRFILVIGAVWKHIIELDFPNVSQYTPNLSGILQFENDLIG